MHENIIFTINQQHQTRTNCHLVRSKDNSYFIIDGRVAADPRLSLECKGFYFVLLTAMAAQEYDREVLKGFDIIWTEQHKAYALELIALGYLHTDEVSE